MLSEEENEIFWEPPLKKEAQEMEVKMTQVNYDDLFYFIIEDCYIVLLFQVQPINNSQLLVVSVK